MRKIIWTFVILIAVVIGVVILANIQTDVAPVSEDISPLGKVAEFTFEDYQGNQVSIADFLGTPMVLNSWAAWCPFCREELPDFATVQKEFGDQVVIIAIDRAESLETAKKYTDQLGVTDDLIFLLDPKDEFYKAIGGFSMPETIFVDKDGNIRQHRRGPMDVSEIRQRVSNLIRI